MGIFLALEAWWTPVELWSDNGGQGTAHTSRKLSVSQGTEQGTGFRVWGESNLDVPGVAGFVNRWGKSGGLTMELGWGVTA